MDWLDPVCDVEGDLMPKIRVPHPHLAMPKVRKRHYRRVLFAVIVTMLAAHELLPAYEHWAALATNMFFFWEPTVEV